MYKTIDQYEFANIFEQSDTYRTKFTRPALMALYDYLEDINNGFDVAGPYLFDMVAIACEFSEYKTALEAAIEYGYNVDLLDATIMDNDKTEVSAYNWLSERTTVISFDGGIIIANF